MYYHHNNQQNKRKGMSPTIIYNQKKKKESNVIFSWGIFFTNKRNVIESNQKKMEISCYGHTKQPTNFFVTRWRQQLVISIYQERQKLLQSKKSMDTLLIKVFFNIQKSS